MAEAMNNEISWTASEFVDHQRGAAWYVGLIGATVGLDALLYLLSKDYFAMVIIALLAIAVAGIGHWRPRQVEYRLTDKGFHIGEKFYPYTQFKYFSIVHEGLLSSLEFDQIKRYLPPLAAFIDADDELAITDLVGSHLPVQPAKLSRIDSLSRRLRL